jgi:GNAT superfamily N-acetyltransferase
VPQAYLDSLSIPARQEMWEDIFRGNDAVDGNLYLAWRNENPVGFISFGKARDPRLKDQAEIYAIYLLQEAWGGGIGHALFQCATETLRHSGYATAYVWVLDSNRNALHAYQRWGGTIEENLKLHDTIGGQSITEVAIAFSVTQQQPSHLI